MVPTDTARLTIFMIIGIGAGMLLPFTAGADFQRVAYGCIAVGAVTLCLAVAARKRLPKSVAAFMAGLIGGGVLSAVMIHGGDAFLYR